MNTGKNENSGGFYNALEESRFTIVAGLVTICALIILVSCLRNPVDFDLWWHLRMGMDLVESGLNPWVDHYSFTMLGGHILNPPIAFEVGFYLLTEMFGIRGGQIAIKSIAYLSLLASFTIWFRQIRAAAWVYILVLPVLVTVVQMRMQVRPELFSYTLSIIALILYQRAQLKLTFSAIAPIALLLFVWNNYHVPLYGYIIFFGLFIEIAVRLIKEKSPMTEWVKWAGWGSVLFAVGFMNGSGAHFFIEFLFWPREWTEFISEYYAPTELLTILTTYVWIFCFVLTFWLAVRRRKIGYIIVLTVFLYGGLTMLRVVPPAMIVALGMLGHLLSMPDSRTELSGLLKKHQRGLAAFLIVVSVFTIAHASILARQFLYENLTSWKRFPESTVAYLKKNEIEGNIFNIFRTGGFLIYHRAQKNRVFHDGRTGILYDIDIYHRYRAAMSSTDSFLQEVEKYNIEFALLGNNDNARNLMQTSGFELEFSDSDYTLYRRNNGRLSLVGLLEANPYCIGIPQSQEFADQLATAQDILAPVNANRHLLAIAGKNLTSITDESVLSGISQSSLSTDPTKRYFLALAVENELYDLAYERLDALNEWTPSDLFLRVLIRYRLGKIEESHAALKPILDSFASWRNVYDSDFVTLKALLDEMQETHELPYLNPDFEAELARVVGDRAIDTDVRHLEVSDFCQLPNQANH